MRIRAMCELQARVATASLSLAVPFLKSGTWFALTYEAELYSLEASDVPLPGISLMCTLTIIRNHSSGIRLVCNRDESRLRPAALPPQVRTVGGRQAVMPIDPVAGGTWIGASDAGLVAVLMNVYHTEPGEHVHHIRPASELRVSRGTIIPEVLRAETLDEAMAIARAMDHGTFEPFQLVVADCNSWNECVWSLGAFRVGRKETIDRPLFFTSSGLGDALVAAPRRKLFDELFATGRDGTASQDEFHRHAWPDRRGSSVWMTRELAMTVSRTEVELTSERVSMSYHARIGDTATLVDAPPVSFDIANPSPQISQPR